MICKICPKEARVGSPYCSSEHLKISSRMYTGETLAEYFVRKEEYQKKRENKGNR